MVTNAAVHSSGLMVCHAGISFLQGKKRVSTKYYSECLLLVNHSHTFSLLPLVLSGAPKFVLEDIADRWLINRREEGDDEGGGDTLEAVGPVILNLPHNPAPYTEAQKFKTAHNLFSKICNLLSKCGTATFQARLPVLQRLHDLWEQQKEVTVAEVGNGKIIRDTCVKVINLQL